MNEPFLGFFPYVLKNNGLILDSIKKVFFALAISGKTHKECFRLVDAFFVKMGMVSYETKHESNRYFIEWLCTLHSNLKIVQ